MIENITVTYVILFFIHFIRTKTEKVDIIYWKRQETGLWIILILLPKADDLPTHFITKYLTWTHIVKMHWRYKNIHKS